MGAQTTVNINDTLRNADNTLASGRLEIFWPAFKTSDGFTVAPGRLSYTVTNGVVNLSLFPNAGGTPSGTSYRVNYYLTSGAGREYWVVPATGPVTIGNIRVSVAPSPTLAVGIGQLPAGSANQLFKTNTAGSAVEHAALTTGTAGTDFNVAFGSGTITMNLPDASPTSRGVVTTGAQTFAGVKTLISPVLAGTAQVGDGAGNDKLEFVEEATDPVCAAGDYFIWANSAETRLRACQNGAISSMAPSGGYDSVKGDSGTANKTGNEGLKIQGTSGEISTVAADGSPDDTLTVSLPATLSTAKTVSAQWTFEQGLLFGNPADTNLYRSAANSLKTDDFLEVDNFFQANAGALLQHDPATVPTVAADTYINATANLSDMANLQASINNIAAGVAVTNWYGTRVYAPVLGAGASLTNAYGIKVENIGVGSNRFAIQTGTGKVELGDVVETAQNLTFKSGTSFLGTLDHAITAQRTWTLPDATTTLAGLSATQNWTAPQNFKTANTVRFAEQFAGADAGAKIAAALADLPSTGGTVDARGFEGIQTSAGNPFSGITKEFTLLLGHATFSIDTPWVLTRSRQIIRGTGTTIIESSGSFPVASSFTVTDCTNATPIVCTTSAAHGRSVSDLVHIASVLGNTAANGSWRVSAVTATTVTLEGSEGNGAYTSGGTLVKITPLIHFLRDDAPIFGAGARGMTLDCTVAGCIPVVAQGMQNNSFLDNLALSGPTSQIGLFNSTNNNTSGVIVDNIWVVGTANGAVGITVQSGPTNSIHDTVCDSTPNFQGHACIRLGGSADLSGIHSETFTDVIWQEASTLMTADTIAGLNHDPPAGTTANVIHTFSGDYTVSSIISRADGAAPLPNGVLDSGRSLTFASAVNFLSYSSLGAFQTTNGDDQVRLLNEAFDFRSDRAGSTTTGAKRFRLFLGGGQANNNASISITSSELDNSNSFEYLRLSRANGGSQTGYNVVLDPAGTSGVFVGGNFAIADSTGFRGQLAHSITANRTWTFPDVTAGVAVTTAPGTSGTDVNWSSAGQLNVPDASATARGVVTTGAQTISGAKTFTSALNTSVGYQIGGAAASGNYLRGDGTNFVSSAIQASDLPATVVQTNQANTYDAGQKQTFQNSATAAGLNLASSADPTTPAQGDLWLNGDDLKYRGSAASQLIERQSNKDAANGYAGLTASTKLLAAQGQEVWALADLTDVTGVTGSGHHGGVEHLTHAGGNAGDWRWRWERQVGVCRRERQPCLRRRAVFRLGQLHRPKAEKAPERDNLGSRHHGRRRGWL